MTGHDDQHLMWGALIRRSVVCCTPAPAPAPLSLRDDRVEGATTELTAVGGTEGSNLASSSRESAANLIPRS